jgi:hypothetical protein
LNTRLSRLEKKARYNERLAEILFDTDLIGVRVMLTIGEFGWAVALLWPGDTFGRPTYHYMSLVAREEWWGFLFLVTAWCQWNLVLIGDFKCVFARCFAGWNAALWLGVCVSMYYSVYPPPAAISGEMALACGAGWIFVRPWVVPFFLWVKKLKERVFK